MTIIGVIIAGAIVGALARLVMPGRQPMGFLVTILLGIVGVLVGWWLAGVLGVQTTSGVDWLRWIISIIVAVVAIVLYEGIMRRGRTA
jgi:uncharacterized membrane protein YeaQ/YmgE (transglycosylase-associated protein family)